MLVDSLSYSFSDPVASQLLQGIAEVLVENGKQMLLLSSALDSAEQSSAESLPDGFILYGALQGNSFEQIKGLGKPIVKVDYQSGTTHSVNIDNEAAAFIIAQHALKDEMQSVAILGLRLVDSDRVCRLTPQDLLTESQDVAHSRLKGYLRAAKDANVDVVASQIWHVPINNAETAEVAVREVLGLSDIPKVILCMSDVIALAALRVAKELGINVPEQLCITGFDDTPEATRSEPALTTICQQSIEKGRVAAKLLLNTSQGDNAVQKIILDTRLVIRQSCP
jgi:DNA-binding LacI/PurR family transcriptional regulator